MFDIQWGKRTAIYAVVFHGDYSSSLADAAISSSEGRVARDAGHSGDSRDSSFDEVMICGPLVTT